MSYANIVVCFSLLLFGTYRPVPASTPPGLQVRLSQPGLQYAANVVVEVMSEKVKTVKIPDLNGKVNVHVGKVEYDVTNSRVTNFHPPSVAVTVNPASGIILSLSGASVGIHGDWRYKYKAGFVHIKDHGSFDASADGISLSVSVTLGTSVTGEPTISAKGCSCNIGHLHIKLHGGASWFYDLFMKFIEDPIRNSLRSQICKAATDAIDKDANKELSTLKVRIAVGKQWLLDYRLVSAPAFAAGYLESFHKGEFFYATDPTEAPFQPAPFPPLGSTQRMVTFWVSEYVLNTVGYVLHKHGALSGRFTRDDLPADRKVLLNTTCGLLSGCIGVIIPEIGRAYPHSFVEVEIFSNVAPVASVSSVAVVGIFDGTMVLHARLTNGSLVPLFTLRIHATASVVPKLEGVVVKATVSKIVFDALNVTESSIGNIKPAILKLLFDGASVVFVTKLNEVSERGFPLPTIEHMQLHNAGLQLLPHSLRIQTDVRYKPNSSRTLYFEA